MDRQVLDVVPARKGRAWPGAWGALGALSALACLLVALSAGTPLAAAPADLSAQVDALFSPVAGGDAPGAAVLVSRSGEVLHAKGYGLANVELGVPNGTNTVFRLGSITKSFTATAILQLHDRGLLDMDGLVANYLPDVPHAGEITIRHLLTHTSGLTSLEQAPLEFAPGERMNYSNPGYHLLGRIIEKVSGDTYEGFLRKNIFDPLGMTGSGYEHQAAIIKNRAAGYLSSPAGGYVNAPCADLSGAYAAGALYSTVGDTHRFDQALSSGKLLRPDTLAQAFSSEKLTDGRETGYGFGWMVGAYRGLREIASGGDITGFNSWISRFPDHDLTVVVLSNVGMRPSGLLPSARDLAHRVAEIYLGDSMEPEQERAPVVLSPETLQRYVGQYRAEGAPQVLEVMGDLLTFTTDGSILFVETKLGKVGFVPESETTFGIVPDDGTRITFVMDDSGRANTIIISLMGVRELRAKRVEAEPK